MISPPFAKILASGRAQLNQRALEARRRQPALDLDAFADFLKAGVDGVVDAVAAVAPERVHAVTFVAYDMALELAARALVGRSARSSMLAQCWSELAPRLAPLLAREPAATLAALTNAVLYLESVAGARPRQWLQDMVVLGPQVASLQQLEALGQVLAWKAGVAHFRGGALDAADTLPEPLALAAFGASRNGSWQPESQRLRADPWYMPCASALPSRELGAFTGFGGQFPVPPQLRPCAQGFAVRSGDRFFLLVADAFGAVLHGAAKDEFDRAGKNPPAAAHPPDEDTLHMRLRQYDLGLPSDGLSLCCDGHTIAVTSTYSHAIRLFPNQ